MIMYYLLFLFIIIICSIPISVSAITTTTIPQKTVGNVTGIITKIRDADTIEAFIPSVNKTIAIRFALVNTPEIWTLDGKIAKVFTSNQCPVGSAILFDPDRGQYKSYNRNVGIVYCMKYTNLSELLLEQKVGILSGSFCAKSEFRLLNWTGC